MSTYKNTSGNLTLTGNNGLATLAVNYASTTLQGYEVLGNIGSTPAAPANAVAIYNKAQGAGGTGLYVKSSTTDDELISLTKARLYSIIF